MPGRNKPDAVSAFVKPLQRSISCISTAKIVTQQGREPYGVSSRAILDLAQGGKANFALDMSFEVYQKSKVPTKSKFSVHVTKYIYVLEYQGESVAFHWHPDTNDGAIEHPHLHIEGTPASALARGFGHIPTGRVTLESILYWLIADLGATPKNPDWNKVLTKTHKNVTKHWRAQVPTT